MLRFLDSASIFFLVDSQRATPRLRAGYMQIGRGGSLPPPFQREKREFLVRRRSRRAGKDSHDLTHRRSGVTNSARCSCLVIERDSRQSIGQIYDTPEMKHSQV